MVPDAASSQPLAGIPLLEDLGPQTRRSFVEHLGQAKTWAGAHVAGARNCGPR